jgi:hypothetical protein
MSKRPFALILCLVLVAADPKKGDSEKPGGADAKTEKNEEKRPKPDPKLTPGQVVRIVMDALKKNDAKDNGIVVTFDFASPANKEATGPLERFIPMVKGAAYAPMLNYKSAKYSKTLLLEDDQAMIAVSVVDAKGEVAFYMFQLSKQSEGDLKDCWMTDGVTRVKPGEDLEDLFKEAPDPGRA